MSLIRLDVPAAATDRVRAGERAAEQCHDDRSWHAWWRDMDVAREDRSVDPVQLTLKQTLSLP